MIGTLRRGLLDCILTLGESHLCLVLAEFLVHCSDTQPRRTLGGISPHRVHVT